MKTMILAAAALSLGVGAAYAQGVPAGYQEPHYGAAAFSDHPNAIIPIADPNMPRRLIQGSRSLGTFGSADTA
jgi:hypothetical protein